MDSEGETKSELESMAGVIGMGSGGDLSFAITCKGSSNDVEFPKREGGAENIGDIKADGETCCGGTGESDMGARADGTGLSGMACKGDSSDKGCSENARALPAGDGEVDSAAIADTLYTSEGAWSSSVKDKGVEGYAMED